MKLGLAGKARLSLAIIVSCVFVLSVVVASQIIQYQSQFIALNQQSFTILHQLDRMNLHDNEQFAIGLAALGFAEVSHEQLELLQETYWEQDEKLFDDVKRKLKRDVERDYRQTAQALEDFASQLTFWLGATFASVLLGVVAVYFLIERSILHRVFELQNAMEALSNGEQVSMPIKGNDEVSRMAKSVAVASERLITQQQELRNAYQEQALLIRMFSHEYRTPLSIISGALNLLRREVQEDIQQRRLDVMTKATKRLKDIVDVSLSKKQLEAPHSESIDRKVHCSLENCVKESIALQKQQFPGRDIQFNCTEAVEVAIAQADLAICMDNLIANGLKYSEAPSPVTIRVKRSENRVLISIEDQGIGIDSVSQERVFDKYFRAPNVETISGAGLGLHIVRSIALFYRGELLLKSTLGSGSCFTLSIPLWEPSARQ